MVAAIGLRIRPNRRTQQREAQHIALIVVSKLGFIDQAEAMLSVAKIGPALRRDFELRLLPTVVPRRGAFNAAKGISYVAWLLVAASGKAPSAERGSHASRCRSPHST